MHAGRGLAQVSLLCSIVGNKTKVGGVDATMGDITAQVILAIQPILIKTVTSAVTAAVSAAFRHLKDEIQGIEIVKEEQKAVKEELRAAKTNMQINRSIN